MVRSCCLIVACVTVLCQASLVSACINDRESRRSEKEFKSSYQEDQSPVPQTSPEEAPSAYPLLTYGGSGLGLTLLVVGGIVGLRSRKS